MKSQSVISSLNLGDKEKGSGEFHCLLFNSSAWGGDGNAFSIFLLFYRFVCVH